MKAYFLVILALLVALPVAAQEYSADTAPWTSQDVQSWQAASPKLKRRVDTLAKEKAAAIPIPVLFGVRPQSWTPNFGDRRGGGRIHEGEDMMALPGTPVVSPTVAVVLRTGEGASAGKYVYTANPGGETFVYMHLDEIADLETGERLQPGDLIGFVGNTGNAAGGSAHLHFEIRNGEPLNPYPRLTKEFSAREKTKFLDKILDDLPSAKEKVLAAIVSANYRAELTETPRDIATTTVNLAVPTQDLELGARGGAVTWLQTYLVKMNRGAAAAALAAAGASGYFGPLTRQALIEFQQAEGISPAVGYFGPRTRAQINKI